MPLLLIFALFSLFCPPAAGYFISFLILNWLVWGAKFYRGFDAFRGLPEETRRFLKTVTAGTLAFVLTAFVSSAIAASSTPYGITAADALSPYTHLLLKRSVMWMTLSTAVALAYQRGWTLQRAAKPLAAFLGVYFAYAVLQRTTGVDWVHGFHAVLPPNRQAYGAYRVSGFMGHPISLSYNLMLLILAVYALLRHRWERLTTAERRDWFFVLGFSALNLVLSGSRWPLFVFALAILVAEGKQVWRFGKWMLLGAVGVGSLLAAEGTLLKRMTELFEGDQSIYERVPRLLFWKMHWQMFLDHPLVGVGYAASDLAAKNYYQKNGFGSFKEQYEAHNIFLQTLADSGLLGFAGLLALFASLWLAMRRLTASGVRHGAGMLLTATLVGGLMQNDLRDSTYLYALWLCLALLVAEATVQSREAA